MARAVSNPDDLAPDQLADAAIDLLVRAVEHEVGGPIDAAGLRVTYAPPSPTVTEEQLAVAKAREATCLQKRFAGFDDTHSSIVAAWLFPEAQHFRATFPSDARASTG